MKQRTVFHPAKRQGAPMRQSILHVAECRTASGLRDELLADLSARLMALRAVRRSMASSNPHIDRTEGAMHQLEQLIIFWSAVEIEAPESAEAGA